jgi:hypothetical protein
MGGCDPAALAGPIMLQSTPSHDWLRLQLSEIEKTFIQVAIDLEEILLWGGTLHRRGAPLAQMAVKKPAQPRQVDICSGE